MKKLMALCLCFMMLMAAAACKGGEEAVAENPAQPLSVGRYGESELAFPMPEGMTNQMVLGVRENGGSLDVFTLSSLGEEQDWRCLYFRHTIAPDGTVTTANEAWLNELAPQSGNEPHVVAGKDGALYMCFSDYDADGNSVAHLFVSRDDGKTGEALDGDGIKSLGILTGLALLDDGRIAACDFYDGVLLLLDVQGNKIAALEAGGRGTITSCAAGGGFVAFAVPANNLIRVYNAADGSYADYSFAFSDNDAPQLAVDTDGAVLLLNQKGLYRHAPDGTLWEILIDGATSAFGLPDYYASLLYAAGESPYPTVYVSNVEGLLSYRYDESAVATADKLLNVFSLTENDTVRQAVVAFNRTRPDVKVTYTVAMEGAAGGTEQDYIKALNTELLAGTGPDILILDGLPVDSYIEKDVLADLTPLMAGAEPMQESVAAAYARDGGLYAIPTGFTVPLAIALPGTETAFDSLPALAEAAEAAEGTPLLSNCAFSYRTLAIYLLSYYGGGLYNGNAADVEAFLTDAMRVSKATGCTDKLGAGWTVLSDLTQDEMYESFSDYISAPQVFSCASGLAKDILTQPMGSVMQCMEPLTYAAQNSASVTSVNGQFVPQGVVGINKAGAEQEAAAAFVQTLLSYSAQGGNQYTEQFPVNKQALLEMLAYQNDGVSSGFMLNDGGDFTAEWPDETQREALKRAIEGLDKPILTNTALADMLLPEIVACLDGTSTVSEATEKLTSLLATYLAE